MRYLITAVLAFMLSLPVAAQDYQKGVEAHDRGDFATALREWRPLAEQGDAKAQFNLGGMYEHGQGVTQDHAVALMWYRRAAEQGDAKAQFNLGGMYEFGLGVTEDGAEAVKWYRKAAEQGDAKAQIHLALIYDTGMVVPQDYVQAYVWYKLAVTQGDEKAVEGLDFVAKQMTPAQLAEAQRLAREWMEKHQK